MLIFGTKINIFTKNIIRDLMMISSTVDSSSSNKALVNDFFGDF